MHESVMDDIALRSHDEALTLPDIIGSSLQIRAFH